MSDVSCRTCRFFQPFGGKPIPDDLKILGQCRRRAPTFGPITPWPDVSSEDWCGEWETGATLREMLDQ